MEIRAMKKYYLLLIGVLILWSCSGGENNYRYDGRMDADILQLSAQTAGIIDSLTIGEGDEVKKGQPLIVINTDKLQTQLQRQQAQLEELDVNIISLRSQIKQLQAELDFSKETLKKTEIMLQNGAATEHQRDELQTKVNVLKAQRETLNSNYRLISSKRNQLNAAVRATKISINDANISAPIEGTVLNKFHYQGEFVAPGMPLLEIANLNKMKTRVYLPLEEVNKIKIGQQAKIYADGIDEPFAGTITWVASQSEFTPKTILTKETRTTLVYAVKVEADNSRGLLKIGMPVEVEIE